MPTPRVAFLCGSGLVGPTLGGWCVNTHPGTGSLTCVKDGWGFSCRVPFGPVAAFLRTNHQHPEEFSCSSMPMLTI